MVTLYINNIKITMPKNSTLLEACESIGLTIPRFCYHERLKVAGNCRMCLVEIEKAPKPVASCAYPISKNLRVFTDTPLVKKARENILEFLLANHPLDCPICDQGGECDLQEQAYAFGSDRSRFFYNKRAVEDKNCGPIIKTIMTRCIHCTRCVRFFQEICGSESLGTTLRGGSTEIGPYVNKLIFSELSGNVVDLCPVGALTSKPYAFNSRPWELKSLKSIDLSDGLNSNIVVNIKENQIVRILPQVNDEINEEWLSDKGRFFYDGFIYNRITNPIISSNDKSIKLLGWRNALHLFLSFLKKYQRDFKIEMGSFLDLETSAGVYNLGKVLNVPIDNFPSNKNLFPLLRFNSLLSNVERSDQIFLIGTNPRYEASLLNTRMKRAVQHGCASSYRFGLNDTMNYDSGTLSNSYYSFIKLLEGSCSSCKKSFLANFPLICFNSNLYKTFSYFNFPTKLYFLTKFIPTLKTANWIGINFISDRSNILNEASTSLFSKSNLMVKSKVYVIGEKLLRSLKRVKNLSVFAQSSIFTPIKASLSLVMPSTTIFEKEGTFFNIEGQIQKTGCCVSALSLARDHIKIIEAILLTLKKGWISYTFDEANCLKYTNNGCDFTFTISCSKTVFLSKVRNIPIKSNINEFFRTDPVSINSQVLSKANSNLRKIYTNFSY